ncbi:NAD-dependent epimerase/dehydratase family protein [Lapidilactobacillus bayanensis]|uniref:NAD-dependent epimerase/dehydratase family protein n=1 Tax=Lapidilactobacillus bayanensis TaxID=2485998 RepID=UPI000F78B758|nr:NAD-dependent epimerase/dehydratase family protein [Lapidilactobacillus bayanensis]
MNEKVLVTGGNGFLALHLIKKLLTDNFQVRATLRHLDKKSDVLSALKQNQTPHLEQLSFVQTDLTQDDDWITAMRDITYVMSVAAPVFVNEQQSDDEICEVATEGTLRIIKAAEKAHVKRVVMTANFGAVGFSNKNQQHTTTEKDWTDPNEPGLSLYEKSKLIAEKSAWNYLKDSQSSLEFTTINPGVMLGPTLDRHISGSFGIINRLIDDSSKFIPNIKMNLVDVRDVADLHVAAMINPQASDQRFIAVTDQAISLPEIAQIIRINRPDLTNQVATKILPAGVIKFAARFNQQAKEGRLFLEINHHISTQKARQLLNWQPKYDNQAIVLSAVDAICHSKS